MFVSLSNKASFKQDLMLAQARQTKFCTPIRADGPDCEYEISFSAFAHDSALSSQWPKFKILSTLAKHALCNSRNDWALTKNIILFSPRAFTLSMTDIEDPWY